MFGRTLMALAGGLLFAVGPSTAPAPVAGTVEGTIRESNGGPLAGAVVMVEATGATGTSDRDGRYRIAGVDAGRVALSVRLVGYAPERRVITLGNRQVARADFVLTPIRAQDERREIAQEGPVAAASKVAADAVGGVRMSRQRAQPQFNTEDYKHIVENSWRSPRQEPLSTFSIDVDAGSYSNVRRFISQGQMPPKDAVRVEEMINYFRYSYPDPRGRHPFSVTTELGDAPWKPGHKLALIGLQSRKLSMAQLPPNNLVFLLDVSGSMNSPDKLPLVKAGFRLLVNELRPEDRVAIVVYAGAAGLVLPSTSGRDKDRILDAIERLQAGGSTAGGAGIQLAYQVAREHFVDDGNNRVILATDGDFNVGVSSEGDLIRMIEERRESGVFLTVLGFGTGNLKDAKMEQLANKGNGHYAYIDDLLEAKKVLVQELGATLLTIAKDVKLQVEFNPARVQAYRLVGYENRVLANEDFNDDTKDAGDMGAGHAVTALYEIVPVGVRSDVNVGSVDPLRYQERFEERRGDGDWFTVKLRYKAPTGSTSQLLEATVRSERSRASEDLRFASAVASFGMLLRESEHMGRTTFSSVLALARGAKGSDDEGYRAEFIRLVETASHLARSPNETTER